MIIVDTDKGLRRTRTNYLKANRNAFKNWYCGVGFNFLSIKTSGNVYGSVCNQGGSLGNIYKKTLKLPKTPIRCPIKKCYCGSDLYILKSKRKEDFKYLPSRYTKDFNKVDYLKNEKIKTIVGYWGDGENHMRINWIMSKRCNYDCSYCPSSVHDNFSPHLSFEKFKIGFDSLLEQTKGKKLSIRFTGGEPTINPDYMKMVRYVKSFDCEVHTNTNGTAHPSKLIELINAGGIRLSIHQEFVNHDKMIEKIEKIYTQKITGKFNIEYMLLPGRLKECKDFFDSLVPEFFPKLAYAITPLIQKGEENDWKKKEDNDDIMYDYSEEELEVIENGFS